MGGSPFERVPRIRELYPDDPALADEVSELLAMVDSYESSSIHFQRESISLNEQLRLFKDREASMGAQRDAYNSMISQMLDKSAAYANVLMSVGFAGLLTAWTVTSASLGKTQNAFIGLMILISLFTFVCWEILKMLAVSYEGGSLQKVIDKPWPDMSSEERRFHIRFETLDSWFKRAWRWFFLVSFVSGLVAALTLATLLFFRMVQ